MITNSRLNFMPANLYERYVRLVDMPRHYKHLSYEGIDGK